MVTCDVTVKCRWSFSKVCISEALPLKAISWNFKTISEKGKERVPKTTPINHFILK
jgi:hypothetical protein